MTVSDEEIVSNWITKTILNEPALILSGTMADNQSGARLRLSPLLMPKPTTTEEPVSSPDLTSTKYLDLGDAEPAAKKTVIPIKQDKVIQNTSTMRGIKVSSSSSSLEEGTSPSADNQRGLTKTDCQGPDKAGSHAYNEAREAKEAQHQGRGGGVQPHGDLRTQKLELIAVYDQLWFLKWSSRKTK